MFVWLMTILLSDLDWIFLRHGINVSDCNFASRVKDGLMSSAHVLVQHELLQGAESPSAATLRDSSPSYESVCTSGGARRSSISVVVGRTRFVLLFDTEKKVTEGHLNLPYGPVGPLSTFCHASYCSYRTVLSYMLNSYSTDFQEHSASSLVLVALLCCDTMLLLGLSWIQWDSNRSPTSGSVPGWVSTSAYRG